MARNEGFLQDVTGRVVEEKGRKYTPFKVMVKDADGVGQLFGDKFSRTKKEAKSALDHYLEGEISATGGDFVKYLEGQYGRPEASAFLEEAGLPGIK